MCWPGGRVSTILLRALASSVVYIIPTRNETSLQLTRSQSLAAKSSQTREGAQNPNHGPPECSPREETTERKTVQQLVDLPNIARIRTNDVARWPVPYGATVLYRNLPHPWSDKRRGLRAGSASHLCRPLSERIHGDLIPSQLRRRHFSSVGKI